MFINDVNKMVASANTVDKKKKLTHYPRTLQSMKSLSMLQNMKTNV